MEFLMIFLMHKIDVSWVRRLRYIIFNWCNMMAVKINENRDGSFDVTCRGPDRRQRCLGGRYRAASRGKRQYRYVVG